LLLGRVEGLALLPSEVFLVGHLGHEYHLDQHFIVTETFTEASNLILAHSDHLKFIISASLHTPLVLKTLVKSYSFLMTSANALLMSNLAVITQKLKLGLRSPMTTSHTFLILSGQMVSNDLDNFMQSCVARSQDIVYQISEQLNEK